MWIKNCVFQHPLNKRLGYGKCSENSNTFHFLFSVIRTGIHKMFVRTANRIDSGVARTHKKLPTSKGDYWIMQ